MAKNDTLKTVSGWVIFIVALLLIVPRVLASIRANNARLRTQTNPGAAANMQAARAINAAGGALGKLLNPQPSQQGKPSAGATMSSMGGSSAPPRQPQSPDMRWLRDYDPSQPLYGISSMPQVFDPSSIPDVPQPQLFDLFSAGEAIGGGDAYGMFGGWDTFDPLGGFVLAAPDVTDIPSSSGTSGIWGLLYGDASQYAPDGYDLGYYDGYSYDDAYDYGYDMQSDYGYDPLNGY